MKLKFNFEITSIMCHSHIIWYPTYFITNIPCFYFRPKSLV